MSRPRVLISAFSCNPERGSEPGVGHFFIQALAKHCDLTVITEEIENRAAIQRRQREDYVYGDIDFRYVRWPWVDEYGARIDDRGSYHFYRCLNIWEQRTLELARQLTTERRFDLTHHLTMQGYREPGYLWQLPLPFVWGPVGGHAQMPWRYFSMLGLRGCLRYGARNIGNMVQSRLHRRVHRAANIAAAVITNTSAERNAFTKFCDVDATVIGEFGATEIDLPHRHAIGRRPMKIAWSGVHVPRKALPILLRAIARLQSNVSVQAHILGEGPETGRWKELAIRLGVADRCVWHGRLPRTQAIDVMSDCDVFALTSLLDGTSCVLNEAIGAGLPVICHQTCGFADLVNASCGLLIPVRSPRHSAIGFADAITQLATDGALYERLCAGAHDRIAEISAARRERQVLEVYERVLGRRIEQGPRLRIVAAI